MKAKTMMKIGVAAAMVTAMTMYFRKNPDAFEKMKNTAMKMMNKTANMDFDALYDEM